MAIINEYYITLNTYILKIQLSRTNASSIITTVLHKYCNIVCVANILEKYKNSNVTLDIFFTIYSSFGSSSYLRYTTIYFDKNVQK